jgi:hypothetical protein
MQPQRALPARRTALRNMIGLSLYFPTRIPLLLELARRLWPGQTGQGSYCKVRAKEISL